MSDLIYREFLIANKCRVWKEINNGTNPQESIINITEDSLVKQLERWTGKMGVYGGGMAMLSKSLRCPTLLYSPQTQEKYGFKEASDNFEYINTPYTGLEWEYGWVAEFIDLLFLVSRDTQCPEYIKNISKKEKDCFEYDFEYELRNKYELLHCSVGEIIYFILFWRAIIELMIANDKLDLPYNDNLFDDKNHKQVDVADFKNRINKLFKGFDDSDDESIFMKKLDKHNCEPTVNDAMEAFIESFKPVKSIEERIFAIINAKDDVVKGELNKYLHNLEGRDLVFHNTDKSLLPRIIKSFVEKTGLEKNSSLKIILRKLHEVQRFPVFPYYFMTHFDNAKKLKNI